MFAHDASRYVGDICGWLHQIVAIEFDLVSVILSARHKNPSNNATVTDLSDEWKVSVAKVLNYCLSQLETPLRVRFSQVLYISLSVVTFYKLIDVLQFYIRTLTTLLCNNRLKGIVLAKNNSSSAPPINIISTLVEARKDFWALFIQQLDTNLTSIIGPTKGTHSEGTNSTSKQNSDSLQDYSMVRSNGTSVMVSTNVRVALNLLK